MIPLFMLGALVLFGLVLGAGVPLVSVIFFVFACQCAVSPLAIAALYGKDACAPARHVALGSLVLVMLGIIALFMLSASASSLSLAYAYSYLAPVVAVAVPLIAFMCHGFFARKGRSLSTVALWFIRPPQATQGQQDAS